MFKVRDSRLPSCDHTQGTHMSKRHVALLGKVRSCVNQNVTKRLILRRVDKAQEEEAGVPSSAVTGACTRAAQPAALSSPRATPRGAA